ncbi:TonB-dependent receptor, partial [Algoriphagus sp. AGSA1]|nr:TonB-dependent receptor [Algoriphagus sp. AGSA1]
LGASTTLGDWFLGGTAMALDTEYKKGVANIGKRVAGAPRFIAAAQVGYNVPQVPGLQLYVDAKYTSSTPLRPNNEISVDSYTLVNIGANYDTRIHGYDTTFRLAVNNVFNKKYWMYQYSDYIKAGDPTTVSLSASMRF